MARTLSPREILDKLVSFPTVSRDSNLPLVDWLEDGEGGIEQRGLKARCAAPEAVGFGRFNDDVYPFPIGSNRC